MLVLNCQYVFYVAVTLFLVLLSLTFPLNTDYVKPHIVKVWVSVFVFITTLVSGLSFGLFRLKESFRSEIKFGRI